MSKRFTDTNKYHKRFFRGLPGAYKLLWDYLYHACDHAGIWPVDWDVAQVCIGRDMPIDQGHALELFNADKKRVHECDGGEQWFIPGFLKFQYSNAEGELSLNPANPAHKGIILKLQRFDLFQFLSCPIKEPKKPLLRGKEGDKEERRKKKEEKKGESEGETAAFDFEAVWDLYPLKAGKTAALRHFQGTVKKQADYEAILGALEKYLAHLKANDWKRPQNGSTWFNQWRDWVDWQEPQGGQGPENRRDAAGRELKYL